MGPGGAGGTGTGGVGGPGRTLVSSSECDPLDADFFYAFSFAF